jgi:hypothetical protein
VWPPSRACGPCCQRARRRCSLCRANRAQPCRTTRPDACSSFFGVPGHHATVEDNNTMLVVMKILMSSDTPGQPPLGQPAPRTAGDGDDAANQRPRRLPEEPGRTTPAKTQLDLARLSEVRATPAAIAAPDAHLEAANGRPRHSEVVVEEDQAAHQFSRRPRKTGHPRRDCAQP